jgi:hypothetical protein
MNDIIPVTSSVLDELLNVPDFQPTQQEYYTIDYVVEFPQRSSLQRHENKAGQLYAGPAGDTSQGFYGDSINFLLVDVVGDFYTRGKRQMVRGGRQMWAHDADGKRDEAANAGGPVCKSANGIAPLPKYIGTVFTDHRDGAAVTIGYTAENTAVTTKAQGWGDEHRAVCETCPLGQWKEVDGKRKPPVCNASTTYVVYVLPHTAADSHIPENKRITTGFLALLRGSNSGVQQALEGVFDSRSLAGRQGGGTLPGIISLFAQHPRNKNAVVAMRVGEVKPQHYAYVIGFATGVTDGAPAGYVAAPLRNDDGSLNELFTQLRNNPDNYPYMVLSVPTSPVYPSGKPEIVGMQGPVRAAVMTVVKNNFQKPTLVPDFNLGQVVPSEHLLPFYEALRDYQTANGRETLLRIADLTAVDEYLTQNPQFIPVQDIATTDDLQL